MVEKVKEYVIRINYENWKKIQYLNTKLNNKKTNNSITHLLNQEEKLNGPLRLIKEIGVN